MSIHAVATAGTDNKLFVRGTTCACQLCFGNGGFNVDSSCKWDTVTLKTVEPRNSTSDPLHDRDSEQINVEHSVGSERAVKESDFIVAMYEQSFYIGQVLEVDITDDTVHVNFMAESGKSIRRYKWPSKTDKLLIEREQILQMIDPPVPTGNRWENFLSARRGDQYHGVGKFAINSNLRDSEATSL